MENKLLYKDDVKEFAKENIQKALYFGIATAGALVATYFALDILPLHIILACVAAVTLSLATYNIYVAVMVRSMKIEIYVDRIEYSRAGKKMTIPYSDVESFSIQPFLADRKIVKIQIGNRDPYTGEKYENKPIVKTTKVPVLFNKQGINKVKKKGFACVSMRTTMPTKYYHELASLIGPHKCENIDSLAIR